MERNYKIELTKEAALVLFEFLKRYGDTDTLKVEDQSEQRVLWDLQCLLEKEMTYIFNKDYEELLKEARGKLKDRE